MQSVFRDIRHTLKLAFPMMVGQLGQMLLGLADTVMIGRVGAVELAAVGFVNVLIHIAIVAGLGLSAAVSVQVAHAHGAANRVSGAEALRHGLALGLFLGMGIALGLAGLIPALHLFGQPEEVIALTPGYLVWIAASALFLIPCLVIKSFAEARHHPWPVFGIMMGGVLLNILLNRILIFGMGAVPALGLQGAGMATFAARVCTLAALWVYLHRSRTLSDGIPARWRAPLDREECRGLMAVAGPISGQMLLEYGAFAFSALLIGRFGPLPLAAHQIAITCAATTYMVPLGLSMAVSIRVGHAIGAGNRARCRSILLGAHAMAFLLMGTFATGYFLAGEQIAAFFTPDAELRSLTAGLLAITAVFQLFDGIQIISMGGLRGVKDVKVPMLLVLGNYWGLALPLGAWLGFTRGLEARGLWMGLAVGLALSAAALSTRLFLHLRPGTDVQE